MTRGRARLVLWVALLALSPGTLSAQERWVYRYNGFASIDDEANSLVMGEDGNLYAAGYLDYAVTWYSDLAVISLTPLGGERWVYRYNGPGNFDDCAWSIVMGIDGNLYVAGYSNGRGAPADFTVISLTPAGGERWVYSYDGPAGGEDAANSITAGADSNLYAAGYSETATFGDFTVVSVTPSGGERWVYTYNGPGNDWDEAYSVASGADSNLYAAGYSGGSGTLGDFTVVGLTPAGGELWVYRYDGPGNANDQARSIVMGADSNLYAAGFSRGIGTGDDFTVISLTSLGGERWVYRYNGPGDIGDQAQSILMGEDGNLYVAGWSGGSGTLHDFTIISLTPSGGERWVYTYNGPTDGYDEAYSIVAGTDGNLCAAGRSAGSGTAEDFTVVRLDTSGTELWVYHYNGPGSGTDKANSIAAGTDGCLYAAGYSSGSGTWGDFTVIGLVPDPAQDVGTASVDEPADTVTCDDTVLVAATVCNYGDSAQTFDVEAIIASGSVVYADTQTVIGVPSGDCDTVNFANWIVPHLHGALYTITVTTLLPDTDPTNDTATKNTVVWCPPALDVGTASIHEPPDTVACDDTVSVVALVCNYGTPVDMFDVGALIDSSGISVYADTQTVLNLAPGACDTVGFADWVVPPVHGVSYTVTVTTLLPGDVNAANDTATKATLAWCPAHDAGTVSIASPPDTVPCGLDTIPRAEVCNYGDLSESFDVACYFDSSGSIVYGDTVGVDSLPPGDTATVDFSSWTACATHDVTYLMTVTTLLGDDSDPANDSLQKTVTTWCPGIEEIVSMAVVPSIYDLKQSRPNPTRGWTRIDYQLPAKSSVCLRVYDLKGTIVRTLVSAVEEAGFRTVVWDGRDDRGNRVASGVYFYRFTAGGRTTTKRMVVVR